MKALRRNRVTAQLMARLLFVDGAPARGRLALSEPTNGSLHHFLVLIDRAAAGTHRTDYGLADP